MSASHRIVGRLTGILMMSFLVMPILTCPQAAAQERTSAEDAWIKVSPGDTLFSIARRYGVRVADLQQWNNLTDASIRAGMRLRVRPPTASAVASPEEQSNLSLLGGGLAAVDVGTGQTLYSLANRFAMAPDSVLALNPELYGALHEGMRIIVPEDRIIRSRVVNRGETLFGIAKEEGVTVEALRRANGLSTSTISVGLRLNIPSPLIDDQATLRLPAAGVFSILPFPALLEGRPLSRDRVLEKNSFFIAHPTLPVGTVVVISTGQRHMFAEVAEHSPSPRPLFIEGSTALFDALSLMPGDRVTLWKVH